jgi:hypothetical protein
MAAPPLALAAHHGGRGCLQFSEQAADCLEELGAAHVVGVRAKGVYPPPLVWGFGREAPAAAKPFLPSVVDAACGQPPGEGIAADIGIGPTAGIAPDVNQSGHTRAVQQPVNSAWLAVPWPTVLRSIAVALCATRSKARHAPHQAG